MIKPVNPKRSEPSDVLKDVSNWKSVYKESCQKKESEGEPTKHEQNILDIIISFEQFCNEYVNDFCDSNIKPEDALFPQEWLDNTIDQVLLSYWEPILKAAEQYQIKHYRDILDSGYEVLDSLTSLRQNLGLEVPIVLYLENTGTYKRYPFGDIYLIGISILDSYEGDWIAMWHELGHHLYWNSRLNFENLNFYEGREQNFFGQQIDNSLLALNTDVDETKQIKKILNAWTEEIFADVIGTKIAGAEYVNAAFEKVFKKVEKKEDLFQSDGKHPCPYFLPFIRAYAMGKEFPTIKKTWEMQYGEITFTELKDGKDEEGRASTVRIENLLIAIEKSVKNIDKKLNSVNFGSRFSSAAAWKEAQRFLENLDKGLPLKELVRKHLQPNIIEGAQDWNCRVCGRSNSNRFSTCQNCGASRPFWSFLPF